MNWLLIVVALIATPAYPECILRMKDGGKLSTLEECRKIKKCIVQPDIECVAELYPMLGDTREGDYAYMARRCFEPPPFGPKCGICAGDIMLRQKVADMAVQGLAGLVDIPPEIMFNNENTILAFNEGKIKRENFRSPSTWGVWDYFKPYYTADELESVVKIVEGYAKKQMIPLSGRPFIDREAIHKANNPLIEFEKWKKDKNPWEREYWNHPSKFGNNALGGRGKEVVWMCKGIDYLLARENPAYAIDPKNDMERLNKCKETYNEALKEWLEDLKVMGKTEEELRHFRYEDHMYEPTREEKEKLEAYRAKRGVENKRIEHEKKVQYEKNKKALKEVEKIQKPESELSFPLILVILAGFVVIVILGVVMVRRKKKQE